MDKIKKEKKVVKLEEAVENALRESSRPDIFHFCKIYKHWKIIVGDPLFPKTTPFRLNGRVLHILVEDAAYSHQLRFFETDILNLIASPEICGEGVVKKVVFKVGELPRRRPEESLQKKIESGARTPDPALVKKTEEVGRKIKDPELKKYFARYMLKTISKKQSGDEK